MYSDISESRYGSNSNNHMMNKISIYKPVHYDGRFDNV